MTYMATPQQKNPCPRVMKFTISVDPSLVIITIYFVCLIYAWKDVKKKILKGIMHFHTLAQEPLPRGRDNYSFGRPFLGYYYYILSLSNLCLGVEKQIFKEIMHFDYMTYMATP